MTTPLQSPRKHRQALRRSLRWQLPVSAAIVLSMMVGTLVWVASREVGDTLIRAGEARTQTSAGQIASLLEQSVQQGQEAISRVSRDSEVARCLSEATAAACDAARLRLAVLAPAGPRRVELWDNAGSRVLEVTVPDRSSGRPPRVLPPALPPTVIGVSAFQRHEATVFHDTVVEIAPIARADASMPTAARLGYLLVRSTLSLNPPGILRGLVGPEANVTVGARNTGTWTDFSTAIEAPPIDLARDGVAKYRGSDGGKRLGALLTIRGTPWAVWVEIPEAIVVAPASGFTLRLGMIAAICLVLTLITARALSARLTAPLSELTVAAEAIAAHDYTRRVPSHRLDEIGRLGEAFNSMAGQVAESHQRLELRVSERTAALEALRESEARHRAIVTVAFDCIITIDANGLVTEFNPAAEHTFGYRRADAIGRELAELIVPPASRAAHRQGLAHYTATGQGRIIGKLIELTAMRADGTEFPAELAITAIPSEGPPMLTGVVRDITERKRAESRLRESEARTQFALAAARTGIWEIDLPADRVTWSPTMAAVFGRTPDQAPDSGQKFFALIHADDRQRVSEALQQAIAEGTDYEMEFRAVWPDSTVHWVYGRARVRQDANGRAVGVLGIAMDIGDRKSLEAQLRQAQKMEAIGQLAGGIAHDFNNLLTAILGYANLVADTLEVTDPVWADVDEIRKAGQSAAGLTNQLLAFSRKHVVQPTRIDLNALITDTSQMLRRLIGAHIQIDTRLAADLASVSADRNQIEQIVMNLAVNARDAMPQGGRLAIETANVDIDDSYQLQHVVVVPGPYVMLSVSDTGVGMSEETKQRLFEPFFTTKERGQGTGLGLATVYGIVKQSGGYVWVYSELNQGSTFKVYLPREGGIALANLPTIADALPIGSETLLVVEDEEAVRCLARTILERAGYHVFVAENPQQAATVFHEHAGAIEMLITDVIMPGSTGPKLYEHLAISHPMLKVLYMSGYTDDAFVRDGPRDPAVAFIQKPFGAGQLLRKVREVIDQPPPVPAVQSGTGGQTAVSPTSPPE